MAESEVVAGIHRCAAVEQQVVRRRLPDFGSGLQKLADSGGMALAEGKFVVQVVDENHSGGLSLSVMGLYERSEGRDQVPVRDDDDFGAGPGTVPVRGMIGADRGGRQDAVGRYREQSAAG